MEPILNKPQLYARRDANDLMFQLIAAEEFEQYLHRALHRRQSASASKAAESLIPLINTIVDEGATLGGEQFIGAWRIAAG